MKFPQSLAAALIVVITFTTGPGSATPLGDANAARNAAITARALARLNRTQAQRDQPPHPCHAQPSVQDNALDAALTAEFAEVARAQRDMIANSHNDPSSDAAFDVAETRSLDALDAVAAIEDAIAAQVDAHGFTCDPASPQH